MNGDNWDAREVWIEFNQSKTGVTFHQGRHRIQIAAQRYCEIHEADLEHGAGVVCRGKKAASG